jgi:hypothetical protein
MNACGAVPKILYTPIVQVHGHASVEDTVGKENKKTCNTKSHRSFKAMRLWKAYLL